MSGTATDRAPTTEGILGSDAAQTPPVQVPALEPPLPLLARLQTRRGIRFRLVQACRETPSWLVSLVAHLTVFLFLASLIVPLGDYDRLDTLVITMGFHDDVDDRSLEVFEFTSPQDKTVNEESDTAFDEESASVSTVVDLPELALPEIDIAPTTQEQTPSSDEPTESEEPVATDARSPAVNFNKVLANAQGVPPSIVRFQPRSSYQSAMEEIEANRRMDVIVDRFIQYDIGKLRGSAGANARRDFDQLGPEAIPALVRGLNRSAYIRASCPIGVISGKLQRELSRTYEQDLLQYTLANLGRGVRPDAPYYRRIRSLRNSIANNFGNAQLRSQCSKLGIEPTDEVLHLVGTMLLNRRPRRGEGIPTALEDMDENVRAAAVVAASIKANSPIDDVRVQIGTALVSLCTTEKNPAILAAAHQTAIELAEGQDFGIAPESAEQWSETFEFISYRDSMEHPTARSLSWAVSQGNAKIRDSALSSLTGRKLNLSPVDRVTLGRALTRCLEDSPDDHELVTAGLRNVAGQDASDWGSFWDQYEADKVQGPRAESLLRSAQALDDRGRRRPAINRYRRLIEDYPQTTAAKVAARRLEMLTKPLTDRELLLGK